MKKLHSLAFYALVTPVITLSSATLLAQQPTGQDVDRDERSTQYDRDDKDGQHKGKTNALTGADHQKMGDQSQKENRGFLSNAPASGIQASDLMGAEVATTGDETVGEVNDLIIDDNGQVVAVSVSVGGFLGMGERNVAIGWDDVTRSGASDELELRIDATRESLRAAPEYKTED